jgi:hypothetical protein
MELNIKTTFDVGQEVFICKPEWPFIEGKFVMKYVPDPQSYRITSIRTHTYEDYTSVYYRLDGHTKSFKEKWIHATYEDAVKCNCE